MLRGPLAELRRPPTEEPARPVRFRHLPLADVLVPQRGMRGDEVGHEPHELGVVHHLHVGAVLGEPILTALEVPVTAASAKPTTGVTSPRSPTRGPT